VAEINKSKPAIVIGTIIGKVVTVVGWIWSVFWGLMAIMSFSTDDLLNDTTFRVTSFILFLSGVLLIVLGKQNTNLIKLYRKYVAQLSIDENHSISNLAASTGQPVDFVRKKLNKMIEKKYFVNAYIDEANGCIVLSNQGDSNQSNQTVHTERTEHSVKTVKTNNMNKTVKISQTITGDLAEFDSAFAEFESAFADFDSAFAELDDDSHKTETVKPEIKAVKCKGCGATNKVLTGSVAECEFCGSYLQA
jgi:hypothetical protein